MKLTEKEHAPKTISFSDVCYGELFIHNNAVFMALNCNTSFTTEPVSLDGCRLDHYDVNMDNGKIEYFAWDEQVIPIEGTMTYERI